MENLKNFSQTQIEQAIAEALGQLTGDLYTAEIKSKESVELSLGERNARAMASITKRTVLAEREKMVFVLSRYTREAEEQIA